MKSVRIARLMLMIMTTSTTSRALTTTLGRHIRRTVLQRIPCPHHGHRLVRFSTLSDSGIQRTPSDSLDGSGTQLRQETGELSSNQSKKHRSQPAPPDPSTFPISSYEPRPFFRFEILHESTKSMARVGRIHTPHGTIDTPSYVAVATNGALKGVDFRDVDHVEGEGHSGQQLVFCNTYHLMLQPGTEVVEGAGGLHKFMNRRDRPLITDSG